MARRRRSNNTATANITTATKPINLVDRVVPTQVLDPAVVALDKIISDALEAVTEAVTEAESLPDGVTVEDDHETTEFLRCLPDSLMVRVRGSRVYSTELLPESRRPFVGTVHLISTTKGRELSIVFGEITLKGVRFFRDEGSTEIIASVSRDLKKLGKKFDTKVLMKELESSFCYTKILEDQAKKIDALCTRLEKQRALRDYDLSSDVLDKYI